MALDIAGVPRTTFKAVYLGPKLCLGTRQRDNSPLSLSISIYTSH